MKIIIIGCGKVGLTLAELLSAEKHDVVLIDESSQKLSSIPEELDALRILGNGASVNIQQEAGVEEADLLIAVTGSDELNLLCCLIAKKAGNCHTIARVRNPIYNKEIGFIKEKLGIKSGSGIPQIRKVGELSLDQLREIAEIKMPDLNANDIEAAMEIIAGTARSMGVNIEGREPKKEYVITRRLKAILDGEGASPEA